MIQEEAERRRRQSDRGMFDQNDNRVLSFRQWCELNGISFATGRRIINAGIGPTITQLSPRRIGVTVANNRAWQAARTR